MANYDALSSTWFGIGIKAGGQFMIGGIDGFIGGVMSFAHVAKYEVYVNNVRLGPGLGGGVGLSFVFLLDCPMPHYLNNQQCSDWGIGLQLGNNWGTFINQGKNIIKGIKALEPLIHHRKALIESGKFTANMVKGFHGQEIEAMKTAVGQIMGAYDSYTGASSSNPKLLIIDSPFPGTSIGVELSAYISGGTIKIQ
jgi:hypothetical protein